MDLTQILSAIDAEIAKLQQARTLLATSATPEAILAKRGPGRPKKAAAPNPVKTAKRTLSPEARQKIAAAQKKRWAAAKKAAK